MGYVISNARMVTVNEQEQKQICSLLPGLSDLLYDSFAVIEIVGSMSPRDWESQLSSLPKTDFYTTLTQEEYAKHSNLLLVQRIGKCSAIYNNSTLCLIKPHIIFDGKLGEVIDSILEMGFMISAMELYHLNKETVSEFLGVYQGILVDYMVYINHI